MIIKMACLEPSWTRCSCVQEVDMNVKWAIDMMGYPTEVKFYQNRSTIQKSLLIFSFRFDM